ncbi:MAG: polysaccharide deacetylase family protein [Bacteroidetes bacterium]|nr:polysaccharide deacetylase family protein [Bacteroidota bacterium]
MHQFRYYFFKILYILGIGKWLLHFNRKNGRVPVLVFHKIIPEYDEIWPGIHPKLFEEILVLVKKHYTILPLNDLYLKQNAELKNACFITFDDGYKDYLDYAYPILRKHNVPSTLFILPYQITNRGHIWTSAVIFFVKHYSFPEIEEFFTKKNIHIKFTNKGNYFKLNLDITTHLCNMTQVERMSIIFEMRQKFVTDNRVIENELLSFDELRMLSPELVSLASHSLTHPSFKKEFDPVFVESELKDSKDIIEQETKREVNAFAFPFANYNEVSINIAKKLYKVCFTRINDFVDLDKIKKDKNYSYDLARFNVHHDSAEEVFLLMNGFHKKLRN